MKILFKILRVLRNRVSPTREKHIENTSFSQCGEDMIIRYIFHLRQIDKPSYLDIGANDPYFLSNTAKFYQEGCRGINIEANPELINSFRRLRPEDVNLNVGLSDKEGELDFYIMEDRTLSTFSKQECDKMITFGKQFVEKRKVKLTTVAAVLSKYSGGQFPDLLSIDVEGMDLQILKSIDFHKSSPKVICVEASEYSPIGAGARRNDLIDFLVEQGYYEYANTNLNAIMVRRDFWFA